MNLVPNPVLVESWRGKTLESFHRGAICVVDKDKNVVFSAGNIHQICFPRSALKLFQHIPLIESGAFKHFGFNLTELAIMCGSHNGENLHQETVQGILQKIGLSENNLKCGPQMPSLKEDAQQLIQQKGSPKAIMNNCSGKHAGFLALSVFLKTDIRDYWKPEHPVQQRIKKVVAEMHETDEHSMDVALDGCSAPIFSLSVYQQAVGYMRLTGADVHLDSARQEACRLIMEAVTRFPYMIGGKNRYCTDMMQAYGNQIAGKTGADGIYSMAIPHLKLGATIKIDDGKMNPQYLVAQHLIDFLKIEALNSNSNLDRYRKEGQKNFNGFITGPLTIASGIFN